MRTNSSHVILLIAVSLSSATPGFFSASKRASRGLALELYGNTPAIVA